MRKLIGVLTLAVACGGDGSGPDLDPVDGDTCNPVGTYEVFLEWGDGDCGLGPKQNFDATFAITQVGEREWRISNNDPSVVMEGNVLVHGQECIISATETDSDVFDDGGSTIGVLSYNLRGTTGGDVSGSGLMTLTSTESCEQAFSVEGYWGL